LVGTAATGGDWPNAVGAYSSNGRNLVCAANSGAVNNGFRCFTFSSTGMTAITGSDRYLNITLTTPPISHTGPSQISFTPDGSALIIINKSLLPAPYYLFRVDSTTNLAVTTPVTVAPIGGAVNFAGAFDTDGTFVTVDASSGVQMLTIAGTTGSSTPTLTAAVAYVSVAPQLAPCWIERSPMTGHFYTGDAGSMALSDISRSGSTLSIVRAVIVGVGVTDVAIASVGGQDFLFTNAGGAKLLVAYQLSTTAAPANYQNLTVTTTNNHPAGLGVYVPTAGSGAAGVSASVVIVLSALFVTFVAGRL